MSESNLVEPECSEIPPQKVGEGPDRTPGDDSRVAPESDTHQSDARCDSLGMSNCAVSARRRVNGSDSQSPTHERNLELGAGSDSKDSGDFPEDDALPYESEHPNKFVPWNMKQYPPDVIEAWTVVHNCALSGNDSLMEKYIGRLSKEVLDQPNDDGETLLFMAACRGYAHIVERLLRAGVTPNKGVVGFTKRSPLIVAAMYRHPECVRKLVEYVDVNEADSDGVSALCVAAQLTSDAVLPWMKEQGMKRHENEATLEILLAKGADVNCRSENYFRPLLCAVRDNNTYAVRRLMECGADPVIMYYRCPFSSYHYPFGVTVLDIAAEHGCTESLEIILAKCHDVRKLMSRNLAMGLALQNGHMPCIQCLIDAGFDADLGVKLPPDELAQFQQSVDAVPVLTFINDKTDITLVKYLLSKGASPLYRGLPFGRPHCRYPLYKAFLHNTDILQLLLEHCAGMESLLTSKRVKFPQIDYAFWIQGHANKFKLLFQAGFDMDWESIPWDLVLGSELQGTIDEVAKTWWTFSDRIPRNDHLVKVLGSLIETPRSLTDLCRVVIRRSIGFPRLAKPSKSVQLLPLPQHLHNYISHS